MSDFAVCLDPRAGSSISTGGTELPWFRKADVLGKPLMDFMVPRFRRTLFHFSLHYPEGGQEEGILTIMDRDQNEQHLEFQALVEKNQAAQNTSSLRPGM
jgi:hypothetical protein